jgi:hypothetical protein
MPVLLKPMTGRRYYITTLADWHRHAHRFANSHWLALSDDDSAIASGELLDATRAGPDVTANMNTGDAVANTSARDTQPLGISAPHDAQPSDATRIIVLVDADEGVHLALDDDAAFEALPHPFAPKAISHAAHEALAAHGVAPGSTTFDAAEAIARAHPLLRPRVF